MVNIDHELPQVCDLRTENYVLDRLLLVTINYQLPAITMNYLELLININ